MQKFFGKIRLLLIALLLLAFFVPSVLAEETANANIEEKMSVSDACPPYLTVFADMEASAFKEGNLISSYLWDYARGMRLRNSVNRLSLKTVGYSDLPGVPESTKAIALVVGKGGNHGALYGLRLGGGSAIGTFDSFSKNGNIPLSELKDSGLAFYIDLSAYPDLLSLQVNLTEFDCYSGGAYTGNKSTFRVQDRSATLEAITVSGSKITLDVYEQHIQIPRNFEGWIMIPFAKMQRVRFDSYDTNRAFDLKMIESVSFFFPPDPNVSGTIYIDQVSFYGPYFKEYSKMGKPEEDSSLTENVEKGSDTEESFEEFDDEHKHTSEEESERVPFGQQNFVLLLIFSILALGGMGYAFYLAIKKDLIGEKEKAEEDQPDEAEKADDITEETTQPEAEPVENGEDNEF